MTKEDPSDWQSQDISLEVFTSSIWYWAPNINEAPNLIAKHCWPWAELYQMATWSKGSFRIVG